MYQFHIEDMTCQHCEASVSKAIKAIDPNAEVSIDLGQHEAKIVSSVDREQLAKAIVDAGFTPR